jgi:O-antigen/teichoic acid export membrane protein
MIFEPREIVSVIFGDEYERGSPVLVILAIAQLINVGTGAIGRLLVMTDHQYHWFLISGAMMFVNIALNYFFIPPLGVVGAALGTACTVGGLFLSGLFIVKSSIGIWPYDERYIKGLIAAISAVAGLFLLDRVEISSSVLHLLLMLIMSCGVFGVMLILMKLDTEDRELLQSMRRRLSRGGQRNGISPEGSS